MLECGRAVFDIAGAKPFAGLAVRLVPAPIISLAIGRAIFDSQAGATPKQLGVLPGIAVGTPTSAFTNRPRLWGEILTLSHGYYVSCHYEIYTHINTHANINIYTLYQHPDPLFETSPLHQHPDPLDILSKDSKRRREPGALPTRFVGVNALALQDGALTGGNLVGKGSTHKNRGP